MKNNRKEKFKKQKQQLYSYKFWTFPTGLFQPNRSQLPHIHLNQNSLLRSNYMSNSSIVCSITHINVCSSIYDFARVENELIASFLQHISYDYLDYPFSWFLLFSLVYFALFQTGRYQPQWICQNKIWALRFELKQQGHISVFNQSLLKG